MRVVWIQHVPFEGLGSIEQWAMSRGHSLERVTPRHGAFAHPGDADMLVVMGGTMGATEFAEYPWLGEEMAYLRHCVDSGRLVLGICLGAQLLSAALGGRVTRNRNPEIGWFDVELTAEGVRSPVFGVLPRRFPAFHWHGDKFSAPPGATCVAWSEACPDQAFECDDGRVLGLQMHLEVTPGAVEALIAECGRDLSGGSYVQSAAEMMERPARCTDANELMAALLEAMVARHATRGGADA